MITTIPRLGLDVGGVLTDQRANDDTETAFKGDQYLRTTPVPGMYKGVRRLVKRFTPVNSFIVSKCGEEIEGKTRKWLPHIDFYRRTGFNPDHLNFCLTREGKVPIAKGLKLTHFVDDRQDVLRYLEPIVPYRFLFGPQDEEIEPRPGLYIVETWDEAVAEIEATLALMGK